jgi:hypothetical protein
MFAFGGGFPSTSLPELAAAVAQALSGIAAQASTTWFKQHAADGSHGHITATSARPDSSQWTAGPSCFPRRLMSQRA